MTPMSTRTLFDVRVGSMHTLEVLLQIRSSDLEWWNSNLRDHERQLYKLIGRRILPVELKNEIQTDLEREQKIGAFDGKIDKKKGDVVIGEVNLKKMAENKPKQKTVNRKKRENQSTSSKGKSKRKKAKQIASTSNASAQQLSAAVACREDTTSATDVKDKRPKILRESGKWIMGKSIQACYVMEDIDRTALCSMAFRPMKQYPDLNPGTEDVNIIPTQKVGDTPLGQEENLIPLASFRSWNKLSKRLNIWVFKFDPENPTDLSVSEGGGFPRPELLPLSDIFRQPFCEHYDE
ncbi:hypothetical protein ACHAWX_002491 [Stephanocyclus meneghinianus]